MGRVILPTIPEPLGSQIDALIDRLGESFEAGDPGNAESLAEEIWDLIPEPKYSWDYAPQVTAQITTRGLIESGRLRSAPLWLNRAKEAYAPPTDSSVALISGLEGKLALRQGHQRLAFEMFSTIFKLGGARAFGDDDPAYLAFYRTAAKDPSRVGSIPVEFRDTSTTSPDNTLDEPTEDRIEDLSDAAEEAFETNDFETAIELWRQAIALVPNRYTWDGTLMLLGGLGDSYWFLDRLDEAESTFQEALKCPGGIENPWIWLRLGQAQFDLGRLDDAANALISAYMLDGEDVFEGEDTRYIGFLRERGLIS